MTLGRTSTKPPARATDRELAVWIDELTGSDCWLDSDDNSVTVVFGNTGTIFDFPFTLSELRQGLEEFDPGH